MSNMEIQLYKGMSERFKLGLQREIPVSGWLLGWHSNKGIMAIDCLASSTGHTAFSLLRDLDEVADIMPIGVDLVGVFLCSREKLTRKGVEDFLDQLVLAGYKNLDETSEFAFVTEQENGLMGYMYNSSLRKAQEVKIMFFGNEVIQSDCIMIRVEGGLPLTYEIKTDAGGNDEEMLVLNIDQLQTKLRSPVTCFRMLHSPVLLINQSEFVPSTQGLQEDTPCGKLSSFITIQTDSFENTGFASPKERRKKMAEDIECIKMRLLFKVTGDDAIARTISCLPIVHHEKREFQNISLKIPIDVVLLIRKSHTVGKLAETIVNGICSQLEAVKQCLLEYQKDKVLPTPEILHFQPSLCSHIVTLIYPQDVPDADLEHKRRKYHQHLLLPETRPAFRRANTYIFQQERLLNTYLICPHIGLPPSGVKNGEISTVSGSYAYYHYKQDNMNDSGWGCAYRSLQTIVSWFIHQGYINQSIPTHYDIQKALVDVGDKDPSFVGSNQWIGSMEVSYCLQHMFGITSRIINVSSGAELADKGRELAAHFITHGSPIMIGGGVLAHTILGVDFNDKTGELKFLILDPHYTGIDDLQIVQNKGWCGWKDTKFWNTISYYNLCLPQSPQCL